MLDCRVMVAVRMEARVGHSALEVLVALRDASDLRLPESPRPGPRP